MKKWIMIIVGSLLLIVLIAIIWEWVYLKTNTKQEVYILPENFKGIVLIAYDQKDGLEDVIEDGKLTYKIPNNGILKLKRKEVTTLSKAWYFIENTQGKKTVLDYCFPPCDEMKRKSNKVFAYGSGNLTFYGVQPELKTSIFLVSTKKETDSLSRAVEKMNAIDLLKSIN